MDDNVCSKTMSDPNKSFVQACRVGNVQVIKQLSLDPRVNVSAENNSGFKWACYNGHLEVDKH